MEDKECVVPLDQISVPYVAIYKCLFTPKSNKPLKLTEKQFESTKCSMRSKARVLGRNVISPLSFNGFYERSGWVAVVGHVRYDEEIGVRFHVPASLVSYINMKLLGVI